MDKLTPRILPFQILIFLLSPIDVGCVSSRPSSKSSSFPFGSSTDVSIPFSTSLLPYTPCWTPTDPIRYIHPGIPQSALLSRGVCHLSALVGNPQLDRLRGCVLGSDGLPDRIRGSAKLKGTGFQLLVIIFTEFFGVTLAQLIGALAPSIQVRSFPLDPRVTRFTD